MWLLTSGRVVTLFICLVMALALGAASVNAQEATKISGKISATYTQQDSIVVGDDVGHLLTLAVSEGENVSTADNAFMDGAKITNMAYSDLIKGNGIHQGYVKFAAEGGMTFASSRRRPTGTFSARASTAARWGATRFVRPPERRR